MNLLTIKKYTKSDPRTEYVKLLNRLLPLLKSGHYPNSNQIEDAKNIRELVCKDDPSFNFKYPDPFITLYFKKEKK